MIKKTLFTGLLTLLSFTLSAQLLPNKEEEKEITLDDITLYGTLHAPKNDQKTPLAIIIAGSGPSDRNGLGNCYKFLAEELAKNDIASFSYDKRLIGKSKSNKVKEENVTLETYVDDLCHWINLFEQENKYSDIILIGHSEGSLIAFLAAEKTPNIKKVVSLSGAGRPMQDILKEQLNTQLKSQPEIRNEAFSYIDALIKGERIKNVPVTFNALFRPSVQPFLISSFKYDSAKEISKLKMPVLIISGSFDMQITEEDAKNLYNAKPDASYKRIESMNHTLKICESMNNQMKYYMDKTIPISEELVDTITSFIKE